MEKVERKKDEKRGLCGCEDEITSHPDLKFAMKDEL